MIALKNINGTDYHGFTVDKFIFNKREAFVIRPHTATSEAKWIWRAEFLGGFDTVDIEMLNRGYFLAYYKISNMYGSPAAVALMKQFYDMVVTTFHLNPKVIILGFSRGGLYAMNFARQYPTAVSALYLDAPVLDIKSWPGGLMTGIGAAAQYAECLECYDLTTTTVLAFAENPVDNLDFLTRHKIPIAVVAGDDDDVVPVKENCQLLIDYCRSNQLINMYILKPDCAHHPHSLSDPMIVADFLTQYA